MTAAPPRLRRDLTVSRQGTGSGTVLVVKDPVSGRFFRLREAEGFIAEQFDGTTPLEEIRRRTERKFGASMAVEDLSAFSASLERAGLLETATPAGVKPTRRRGRVHGTTLRLRVRAFDPNRLFDLLLPWVRPLFTPHFVALSAVLILLAAAATAANWSDLTQDLSRLGRPSAIPLFVVVVFLVITAHEFAHGLTCKHFGGDVHEVGFMLIYFLPAFYCDVSDAWLFPEKSKRLWVSFAGPYFELFLWALATLAWRITEGETWINHVSLIVMASSGIKTLINFNPFIKLDGYYLLSDYLEIPNLRRRAFRHLGGAIKRVLGFGHSAAATRAPREERVYLLYGLVASVGTFSLVAYVLFAVGGSLVQDNQPVALLLMSGFLVTRFRRRIRRMFGKSAVAAPDAPEDDDDPDGDEVERANHGGTRTPEQPARSSRRSRSWRPRLFWLALAAAVAVFIAVGRMELRVAGPFAVLPVQNADVRAAIEGIVEEIRVTEGDRVRVGDVIARLSDRENRAELVKTAAEIEQVRARLRLLRAGTTRDSIALARAAVDRARDQLRYARARLERNKMLADSGFLSRTDLENTQEQADAAKNDLAEAESRLKVMQAGARPEAVEATKADIARLEAQERLITEQLALAEVRSPAAGIVATPARQLRELTRQFVPKGALIAKVYDLEKLTVEIAVPEREVADVNVGQPVALKARAYPDETFRGTVTSIATTAQAGAPAPGGDPRTQPPASGGSSARTVLVTTEIDNPSLLLKPGMSGQAKISCGERRVRALVMRRVARTVKVQFWSWW